MKVKSLVIFCLLSGIHTMGFTQVVGPAPTTIFPDKTFSLKEVGLEDYPFDTLVSRLLKSPSPDNWQNTKADKNEYLDIMERIVRSAAGWVDDKGAVIDPFFNREHAQTTPRFVSSASVLLHFGRIGDLKPIVVRSMSYSCKQLAERKAGSPDFWMRELTTAFMCLRPVVEEDLVLSWADLLRQVDPEATYQEIEKPKKKIGDIHNWVVYSGGGEYVRDVLGLAPKGERFLYGKQFFEKYMKHQFSHFNREGMYRDPNDPITYDITTRLQIANAMAYGYDGDFKNELNELLRRGGLTMLLFMSPEGLVPYGGRSGQFNFQEAIVAALSELEARRYKLSDPKLAGAFKRQAHKSVLSIRRWTMDIDPLRHIKNGFDPKTLHGIDDYGMYSVYSLFCSSVLGLAALYADDEIAEHPCPAEIGGYLIEISPSFHKIFASVKGSYIEIDTQADTHHESTGLGRFLVNNVPMELGLGMSFTAHPKYRVADDSLLPSVNHAIGPGWKSSGVDSVCFLADLSEGLTHRLLPKKVNSDFAEFDLFYQHPSSGDITVLQQYRLGDGNLEIRSEITSPTTRIDSVYFTVPVLVSNGLSDSKIIQDGNRRRVTVTYLGSTYEIILEKDCLYEIGSNLFANRNGIYRNLVIRKPGNKMQVRLELR